MMTTRGRCLCGEVTYEFDGAENWRAYCHCESCRRNTSSPVTAFFGVSRSAFRFTGKAPAVYASSPGVRRLFCGRCRSEEHTSELPSLMRISYAVFCLKKK